MIFLFHQPFLRILSQTRCPKVKKNDSNNHWENLEKGFVFLRKDNSFDWVIFLQVRWLLILAYNETERGPDQADGWNIILIIGHYIIFDIWLWTKNNDISITNKFHFHLLIYAKIFISVLNYKITPQNL